MAVLRQRIRHASDGFACSQAPHGGGARSEHAPDKVNPLWHRRIPPDSALLACTGRVFRRTTRLSVESPRPASSSYKTGYYAEPFYDGVPFPSGVRQGHPWRDRHPRPLLVSGSFNSHGSFRAGRRRIRNQCLRDPQQRCLFLSTSAVPQGSSLHRVFEAYWNSTFCLQPPGDAISRKGVVDSVLLGCIPVFFHEDQSTQWPWHFAPWAPRASVTLHVGQHADDSDALSRIPTQQVRAMQREIAHKAQCVAPGLPLER